MTIRVQTFLGKLSMEALQQMDAHINRWLEERAVTVRQVHQTFGYERPREGGSEEPVIVTSVWYDSPPGRG